MSKHTVTAMFKSNIEKVWGVVTDNTNYNWRSDLSKITITDDNTFIERTKDGCETEFTITVKMPYSQSVTGEARYEFNMKNKNMSGHWIGIFSRTDSGTQIEFTEEVTAVNPVMRLFAGFYLKKQQTRYIADLKKALGE